MLSKVKCSLKTLYYTLRYPSAGLFSLTILYGHDFEYLDEVCEDHWHMECRNCGHKVASEVGPDAGSEE